MLQHRLAERRKEAIRFLHDDAFFCTCGSARMGLVEALMECKSLISEDTEYARNSRLLSGSGNTLGRISDVL